MADEAGKPTTPGTAQGVGDPYEKLAQQIENEYNMAWLHQNAKKQEQALRLKLYNNQRRDKDAVGDTTMFTIHQTIVASLYDDRLASEFIGREEGDDDIGDKLTKLVEYE